MSHELPPIPVGDHARAAGHTEKTGALILAAGGSSRLGRPKQLLEHEGDTLLVRAVSAAAGCHPVIVVVGRDGGQIAEALWGREVHVRLHEGWALGIGSSIRAGVGHALEIAPDLEALIVMVCDQPFVTAATLRRLREERTQQGKPIVACRYANSLGVPALFARALFPRLQALADDSGAKQVMLDAGEEVAGISFPEGAIDIDTPADAARYLGQQATAYWPAPLIAERPRSRPPAPSGPK